MSTSTQVVEAVGQAEGDSAPDAADDGPGESSTNPPRIEVRLHTGDTDPPAADWLAEALRRVLVGLDEPRLFGAGVDIAIVDDARMAQLHERHTGVAGTTDVLTFDLSDAPAAAIEAELVICADEAARQGAARGHDARLELLLYCVHGLLHLLGHDDHDPDAARRMHAREDELLMAAGFGAVYRAGTGGRDE